MDIGILLQHAFNGLMLGVIYATVALGFSLFFGVLDVINLSHGDVVTVGAFAGLGAAALASAFLPAWSVLPVSLLSAVSCGAAIGVVLGRALVLPLRRAPSLNVLLATLTAGTVLHEGIRLGVPNGGNPKPFPALLPSARLSLGSFTVGADAVLLLLGGLAVIVGTYLVINRTRLGLSIRAVAQDSEVASLSGIDFRRTVLGTFALGSALAALAGCMLGLYYREISFNMGIVLGLIGFAAAVVGGLGSLLGPILGGFLFAAAQTVSVVAMPFSSGYKDVVAFAVIIALIAVFPTGVISERSSERV
jgi:branched-chain amino acid transport system permease protein